MPQSKDRIADTMFGLEFDDLTGGQKAAVTRKFNSQRARAPARRTATAPAPRATGSVEVKYARMGRNGILGHGLVPAGTTHDEALIQFGVVMNKKKEGIQSKATGNTVMFADKVVEGTYVVVPGIDSSI